MCALLRCNDHWHATSVPASRFCKQNLAQQQRTVWLQTLQAVSTARTRIERDFNPEAVRQMKAMAGRDLIVGGPELAAQAFEAGLVDECHLFVAPMVVGGGKQSLPDHVRLKLDLLDERRFAGGMVYLYYRTRNSR